MAKIWKTYKQTIILIVALIIGAIVGIVFKEDAKVLSPLGDLFLNNGTNYWLNTISDNKLGLYYTVDDNNMFFVS